MTDARESIARYLNGLEPGGTWENFTGEADDILAIVMDTIGWERDYAVDALTEIAHLPEQGGCDDEVTAVDLWRLMQARAKQALDKLDAERLSA